MPTHFPEVINWVRIRCDLPDETNRLGPYGSIFRGGFSEPAAGFTGDSLGSRSAVAQRHARRHRPGGPPAGNIRRYRSSARQGAEQCGMADTTLLKLGNFHYPGASPRGGTKPRHGDGLRRGKLVPVTLGPVTLGPVTLGPVTLVPVTLDSRHRRRNLAAATVSVNSRNIGRSFTSRSRIWAEPTFAGPANRRTCPG